MNLLACRGVTPKCAKGSCNCLAVTSFSRIGMELILLRWGHEAMKVPIGDFAIVNLEAPVLPACEAVSDPA
jgi:hypothetical protein